MALDSTPSREPAGGVVYPVCDNMGESALQKLASNLLIDLLKAYFRALEREVFTSGNQFFYYKQGDPRAAVAPDIYTIDDVSVHAAEVKSWKTWEHAGKAPTLAVEIVSDEYRKDYADKMVERYQQLGVRELVRYDPGYVARRKRELFAHFVRDEHGQLIRQLTFGDRVHLVSYDLWIVHHTGDMLRLGVGPKGASLWPTAEERAAAETARADAEAERASAEAARADAEAERAAAEAERAAAEAERAAAEAARAAAAEAELERLRAELAALRRG